MSLSKAAARQDAKPAKRPSAKPAAAKTARDFAAKAARKPRPPPVEVEEAMVVAKAAKSAKLAKSLQEAGEAGSFDGVSDAALQEILAAAVHEYGSRIEDGSEFKPFPARRHVTATDVMVISTAMLKAVGLQLFELGMWQAWSGKH
ncbi:MAG: hypothetical protein JWL84_5653 [Rhodospirillales bacterium]|jgi:hypothetical protein|nr:hypothetical protein [Rhodospirillales bacterium]